MAGQPQQVTRRGNLAVVVLSATTYDRMRQAGQDRRGGLLHHLREFSGLENEARPQAYLRNIDF